MKKFLFVFGFLSALVIIGALSKNLREKSQQFDQASTNPVMPTCRYQTLKEPLTPQMLQKFISQPGIQNMSDLVCCLPATYRSNYVVFHSSFALQSGVPDYPRVLMFSPAQNMVLSINGKPTAGGYQHVEVLSPSYEHGHELYDINFAKAQPSMEKNPTVCMGCHSPNPNEFAIAGPKPILQDFPWPSTVGFTLHLDDSETKKYFQKIEFHATEALKTDPSYACLKPQRLETLAGSVQVLDDRLKDFADLRVIQLVKQTKDYMKIRPLLLGMTKGCFNGIARAPSKISLDEFDQEFPRWVPPAIAETFFADDRYILSNLRGVDNIKQAVKDQADRVLYIEQTIRTERIRRQDMMGSTPALYYPTELFSALYNDDNSDFSRIMNGEGTGDDTWGRPETLAKYSRPTKLLARYALDTMVQPRVGQGPDPEVRFLFEGRGISVATWGKEMAGSYGAKLELPHIVPLPQEKQEPFWQGLERAQKAEDQGHSEAVCNYLKTESNKNFP